MMSPLLLLLVLLALVSQSTGTFSSVQLENQASFSVRQTSTINLDTVIHSILTAECGLVCSTLEPYIDQVIPTLNVVESLSGQANISTANLDLLLNMVSFPPQSGDVNTALSNIFSVQILPATAVAYFTADAKYTASFGQADIDFSAQAFAIFQSYSEIIEYHDSNGNKVYDQGEMVSSYSLGAPSSGWQATTSTTTSVGSATVYTFSATTSDNIVTFSCSTSSYPVIDSNNQVITPNATKCSITINNYKFQGTTSYLALSASVVVVGAQFAGSATDQLTNFQLNLASNPSGTLGGQFHWTPSVSVGSTQFAVSAAGSAGANNGIVDFATYLVVKASGSATTDVRNVIFSFKTNPNPSQVFWDPVTQYGAAPVVASSSASSSFSFSFSFASFLAFLLPLLAFLL